MQAFFPLQIYLTYMIIADSYQSNTPLNNNALMGVLSYCGVIGMEFILLNSVSSRVIRKVMSN